MALKAVIFVATMSLCMTAAASPSTPSKPDSGFYSRLGLGVGMGNVTSRIDVPNNRWSVEYEGVGWVFDVVAGSTIDGWLGLGGGLFLMGMPALSVEEEPGRMTLPEALDQRRLGMGTLGPVVDVFLDQSGNLYVGATGGIGGIGFDDEVGGLSQGWSIGLHGGYDVWVSDAWTVGVSLRYLYLRCSRTVQAMPGTTQPGRIAATSEDSANTVGLLFNVAYR